MSEAPPYTPAIGDRVRLRAWGDGPGPKRLHGAAGTVAAVLDPSLLPADAGGPVYLVETAAARSAVRMLAAELVPDLAPARPASADRPADRAKEQGFTGNACSQCGGFKVVRNGSCELCRDCGSSSGCG